MLRVWIPQKQVIFKQCFQQIALTLVSFRSLFSFLPFSPSVRLPASLLLHIVFLSPPPPLHFTTRAIYVSLLKYHKNLSSQFPPYTLFTIFSFLFLNLFTAFLLFFFLILLSFPLYPSYNLTLFLSTIFYKLSFSFHF